MQWGYGRTWTPGTRTPVTGETPTSRLHPPMRMKMRLMMSQTIQSNAGFTTPVELDWHSLWMVLVLCMNLPVADNLLCVCLPLQ